MKLNYRKIELPFEYPFTISGGRTKTNQPSLIVALQLGNLIGYGEAPAITYYNITVEQMIADIENKKSLIEKFALTTPDRYWHYLHHLLPGNPFLVCALDMAAWDLFGKMRNQPLYKLWNTEWENIPVCDYTLGIDSIDKMIEKMQRKPWPIYKIKVGTARDIENIEALRKHTDAVFYVDANAGWTLGEAIEKIPVLKDLGVKLIEQPLAKDEWDDMKVLFEQSPLPLFADESCVFENDVEKCAGCFHGINIKLVKCSGITPALRMVEKTKQLNLKLMMGSMNECTIGSAAIAHFLPQLDYVDMDGPLLLKEDIATGLKYEYGVVTVSNEPGLGIETGSVSKKTEPVLYKRAGSLQFILPLRMLSTINLHNKFEPEKFYHVIAKAVDGINLFVNDENKSFFLKRFANYIPNFADIYAYCLLNNHVHCMIKPKSAGEIESYLNTLEKEELTITQKKFLDNTLIFDFNELIETQLNYLFVSYVRSFNKVYYRKGGMFNKPFKCIEVTNDFHFNQLIIYIHANPLKHKLIKDFTKYRWSSYQAIISTGYTLIKRDEILEWFGSREKFIETHQAQSAFYYGHDLSGE